MKYKLFWSSCFVLVLVAEKEVIAQDTVFYLPDLCGMSSGPSPGQIIQAQENQEIDGTYTQPVAQGSCNYTIMAANSNERIKFGIGTGQNEINAILHDGGCSGAALFVYDTDRTTLLEMYCGELTRGMDVFSSGDELTLSIFTAGGNSSILNFTAHFTSFSEDPNCGSTPGNFLCTNLRCISSDFVCDSSLINNCGDFSDNSPGPPANCSMEDENTTTTTMTTTTTTDPALSDSNSADDIPLIVGAALGGVFGAYALYWLLWKPGYLVWRCSCWRHWCRSHSSPSDGGKMKPNTKPFNSVTENGKNAVKPSPKTAKNAFMQDHYSSPNDSKLSPPTPLGIIRNEPHIFL